MTVYDCAYAWLNEKRSARFKNYSRGQDNIVHTNPNKEYQTYASTIITTHDTQYHYNFCK